MRMLEFPPRIPDSTTRGYCGCNQKLSWKISTLVSVQMHQCISCLLTPPAVTSPELMIPSEADFRRLFLIPLYVGKVE